MMVKKEKNLCNSMFGRRVTGTDGDFEKIPKRRTTNRKGKRMEEIRNNVKNVEKSDDELNDFSIQNQLIFWEQDFSDNRTMRKLKSIIEKVGTSNRYSESKSINMKKI